MNWARIKCWWKGHDIVRIRYVVKDTKKYHGHDEVRQYRGCGRCGVGSPENELGTWWDEKGFYREHETKFGILAFLGSFVAVIFVIAVAVMLGSSLGCRINGEIMELPWKFNWITGACYYELDGRWIARSLLTVVDVLK